MRRLNAEHAEKFLGTSSLRPPRSQLNVICPQSLKSRAGPCFSGKSSEVCRLAGFQERMGLAGADWLYTVGRPPGCWVDQQRGWVPFISDVIRQGRVARGGCCETFFNRCTPVDWCCWRLFSDEHAHLVSTSP